MLKNSYCDLKAVVNTDLYLLQSKNKISPRLLLERMYGIMFYPILNRTINHGIVHGIRNTACKSQLDAFQMNFIRFIEKFDSV